MRSFYFIVTLRKLMNITLIGSYHANKGICNHNELYKIIERINPEVIFEEKPSSFHDVYYKDKSKSNLESDAINQYLENNTVIQIPVDNEIIPPDTFFNKSKYMYDQIEKRSRIYRNLIDTNAFIISQSGFRYLNSIECLNYYIALENEIEETLKFIGNDDFYPIRKSWLDWVERRDNVMMSTIYNYCKENKFNTGLFIVGTAHRKSIIEKIPVYNNEIKINWNYSDYKNIIF